MSRLSVPIISILVFALLASTLLYREPSPNLSESDQVFYHSIAYDLDRYGVFSNGVWGPAGDGQNPPPAGMMYMPLYPTLIWLSMKFDGEFAQAIECPNRARHDPTAKVECPSYTRPMMIIHALLLSIGIVAVALAGRMIIPHRWAFPVTAALAAGGILSHAGHFSYMRSEERSCRERV